MINSAAFEAIEKILPIVTTEEISEGIYVMRYWQGGQFGDLLC